MDNLEKLRIKMTFEEKDYFLPYLDSITSGVEETRLADLVLNLNRVAQILKEIKLKLLTDHYEFRIAGPEYMMLESNAIEAYREHQLHFEELNRHLPFSAESLNIAFVSGVFARIHQKKRKLFIREVIARLPEDAFYVQLILSCIPLKEEWQDSNNTSMVVFCLASI